MPVPDLAALAGKQAAQQVPAECRCRPAAGLAWHHQLRAGVENTATPDRRCTGSRSPPTRRAPPPAGEAQSPRAASRAPRAMSAHAAHRLPSLRRGDSPPPRRRRARTVSSPPVSTCGGNAPVKMCGGAGAAGAALCRRGCAGPPAGSGHRRRTACGGVAVHAGVVIGGWRWWNALIDREHAARREQGGSTLPTSRTGRTKPSSFS